MGFFRTAMAPVRFFVKPVAYTVSKTAGRAQSLFGVLKGLGTIVKTDLGKIRDGELKRVVTSAPVAVAIGKKELASRRNAARTANVGAILVLAAMPLTIAVGNPIEIAGIAAFACAIVSAALTTSYAVALARGFEGSFVNFVRDPVRVVFGPWE